jgi:hypothetical protein
VSRKDDLARRIKAKSYTDIVNDPKSNLLKKAAEAGIKFQSEMGQGVSDAVSAIPGGIADVAHGLMPTKNIPTIGGQYVEDTGAALKKAKDLADQGKWSEAAKQIPIVGGMYDYATSHSLGETAGAALGGFVAGKVGGKLVDAANAKLSAVPKPSPTMLGATPEIKNAIGILKPANAAKAVKDYPDAIARLKAEDPTLGDPSNPDFLGQLKTAIDGAMTENRHYYEGHVGPTKVAGMKIDLSPVADAIENSISPLLEHEDPIAAREIRKLANKYRTTGDVSDVESMLQEINAKVRAINKQAPGAASQAIRASETKTILDAQAKSMREAFYKGLDNWNVGAATKEIQRQYGKLLGFKLDAEQLYNRELKSTPEPEMGIMGKGAQALQALRHPVRAIAGAIGDAMHPDVDNIAQLQKVFRDYQGQAQPYPTPPVQAPAGRKQLGPAPPPPAGYINAPVNAPAPQGPIPPGMGPSAAYPTNQKALPKPTPGHKAPLVTPSPADTSGPVPNIGPRPGAGLSQQVGQRQIMSPGNQTIRMHPGETYGSNGQGPVVQAEQLPPMPHPPPTVKMIRVQGPHGAEYITQDELYRRLAAQQGRK